MSFDAHKNLAISTVVTPPAPATSGTTLTVTAGEGGRFPAAPFNATVWPASQPPTPANAELVRVTARTSDSLTITRAAEGSAARSIVAGDLIAATITAQVITDIESGTNFPLLTTPGTVTATKVAATVNQNAGVELVSLLNQNAGPSAFASFSVAAGANTANGVYAFADGYSSAGPNLAAGVAFYASWAGGLSLAATHGSGAIRFYTGGQVHRGRMHPSGGLSWGSAFDPGAGSVIVGAGTAIGTPHCYLGASGLFESGLAGASGTHVQFVTASGIAGRIDSSGTTTAYVTASDARLKTDRGLLTDPEVLRSTRVHHFTWNTDGTAGRGVFAQEAVAVLPSAVSIGTDERDDAGNLQQPWGVDYSKYVPDLIAGWQYHDTRIGALFADQMLSAERLMAIEKRLDIPQPTLSHWTEKPRRIMRELCTALRAWRPSWV